MLIHKTCLRSIKLIRACLLSGFVAFLLLLAGCSSGEAGKLIGNWEMADVETVSERVGGESAEESEAKMTVEFSKSGTLITQTQMGSIDSVKTGSWKLLSHHSENGVMDIECVLGGQATQHEIAFDDDSSIHWIPPNMAGTTGKLKFIRVTKSDE